jgi:hypothetical protein
MDRFLAERQPFAAASAGGSVKASAPQLRGIGTGLPNPYVESV